MFPPRSHFAIVVLVLSSLAAVGARADDGPALAFRRSTLDGGEFALTAAADGPLTVVCFLGTECPLARLYGPRLQQLAERLAERPVRFVGIFSNQQDLADEVRGFAAEHGIRFPLIVDPQNALADRFRATRTPEVFVVDSQLAIRYQGRIDDQYSPGIARTAPERQDLQLALTQLLAGEPVEVAATQPAGCLIGRVKTPQPDSDVTYCNQVVRILNRQCVECHRKGEIGPFALTEYDDVVGWADMILEVISQGRMPPWHANPQYGEFANARSISQEEQQMLTRWVAAGAPYGDPSQLPEPSEFITGWQLPREPDLVMAMRERPFAIPAQGTVEYQYFVVDPGFTEDRWVEAAQVVPGNPAVVHHSIVFVRPPDGARFRGVGWLAAYVPGQRTYPLPPGRARLVPAGSKLVFQQHYTPNGRPQEDITRIGMLLADPAKVTHRVITLVGIDQEFEIPPQTPAFNVEGRVAWFPPSGELLAIMPHMHLRGKSFRCWQTANQHDDIILDVPRYDFNWQHVYQLSRPLSLADVDQLNFTVTFDNSSANPFNPDPNQTVTWGDQTWEEMAVAFFEISEPRATSEAPPAADLASESELPEQKQELRRLVDEFLARFDRNGDGLVERLEAPLSFRHFAFARYDDNGDERLARDEIERAFRDRVGRK